MIQNDIECAISPNFGMQFARYLIHCRGYEFSALS